MLSDATDMQYLLSEKEKGFYRCSKQKGEYGGTFSGEYKVPLKAPLYDWI